MAQTLPKLITFDEFVEWIPENSPKRYELYNGVIVEMAQPVGVHEEVEGEYQVHKFRQSDACGNPSGERIVSPTFPELNLTVQEIFQAGNA